MSSRSLSQIEWVLTGSLIVALLCSFIICYHVYIARDGKYKDGFSTWQMPMIFAILADLYLLR